MADLTVTAANVLAGPNAKFFQNQVLGETVTIGQVVYRSSADRRWYRAQATNQAHILQILAGWGGIAYSGGGAGQLLDVIYEDDDFTPGATLSLTLGAGETAGMYVLSATLGGIAPVVDLAANMYPVHLFSAHSTLKANLKIAVGKGLITA